MFRIGIDLGGTKIEALGLDTAGEVMHRARIATPRDYEGSLAAIRELVRDAEREAGQRAHVGIGHPGSLSPATGRLRNANSTWLNGRSFAEDVSRTLDRPTRFANDADCFALSEATDGAGRKGLIVLGVILGTGVGGGIVINGRLLDGAQRIAGEWGHNPLPWMNAAEADSPPCWCGKSGCIETFLSGPGWSARFNKQYGKRLSAQQIALSQSPEAEASRDAYAHQLARALASVINIIDADIIVLGGGVSDTPGLIQRTQARLGEFLFSDVVKTRIVIHHHGASSGVRGAAWLWPAKA
ncbi:ROK family protein [Maricaulis sp.]|uniref:ROK family protein n=1 Tax=Maricaulis sp. TaxID=1486257 RepID=UPI00260E0F77|nr:ROK family protein [Maricaulis sp.]